MTRIHASAIAVLGLSLGWTLFMWFLAGRSFRTADRVLSHSNPQVAEAARPLAPDNERELVRHVASELNRTIFTAYGWAQVVLAALLIFLFVMQIPRDNFNLGIAALMLVLALVLAMAITPQIIAIGRGMDFVPRTSPPPEFKRFWMLHASFTGLDGLKLLASLFLLGRLIVRR